MSPETGLSSNERLQRRRWAGVGCLSARCAALASIATLAVHFLVGLLWGWSALAGFVGWPVIGTLVTIDDDLPGGWSNPDGTVRPDWLTSPFWGQLSLGPGVAAFVTALDVGVLTSRGTPFAIAGVVVIALAVVLLRKSRG